MKKIIIFLFCFATCYAFAQSSSDCQTKLKILESQNADLTKTNGELKEQVKRQKVINSTTTVDPNPQIIKTLQAENDSLRSIIDSLNHAYYLAEKSREKKVDENMPVKFADKNLETFLLRCFDLNDDGIISQFEAEQIVNLNISKLKITSLEGIEYLVNLEKLVCSDNKIIKVDLLHNRALKVLICSNNPLTFLNVSNSPNLTKLYCAFNKLITLDVSKNPELKDLTCHNNLLTVLYLSNNPLLEKLNCSNNQITTLNIASCQALKRLECKSNGIAKLDIARNTNLEYLDCSYNKLVALSLENNKLLKNLNVSYNQLVSLMVKNGVDFELLDCLSNPHLLEIKIDASQKFVELKKSKKTQLLVN